MKRALKILLGVIKIKKEGNKGKVTEAAATELASMVLESQKKSRR